jgi:hypothetical protein
MSAKKYVSIKDSIKPYASYTLFTSIDPSMKTIKKKVEKMESVASAAFAGKMKVLSNSALWKESGGYAKAFTLEELRAASWSLDPSIIDRFNHLVVILYYSGYLGIVITDSAARAIAINAIESSMAFKKIDELELENAFVNDAVLRTLWLRGAHRKDQRKADSKVLFGPRLQDALNPMDDRSFQSSSVRSEALAAQPGEKQRVIGVTPMSSYLWLGPTKASGDLIEYFIAIINHLKSNGSRVTKGIPILVKPVNVEPKPGEVWDAFDFSFVEADLHTLSDSDRQLLEDWEANLEISTTGMPGDSKFRLTIVDGCHPGHFGVDVEVDKWTKGFKCTTTPTPDTVTWPRLSGFQSMLAKPLLWSLWYESGHAVIEGRLTRSDVMVADFDEARSANFGSYDIELEKPVKLDSANKPTKSMDFVKLGHDLSLCSWWLNQGALQIYDKLNKLGADEFAYMLCDDGAGEVADFVLFARHSSFATASNPSCLAIIQVHLKAAGKQKPASPAAPAVRNYRMAPKQFEEVLAQAVKNLAIVRMPALTDQFQAALQTGKNPLWTLQGTSFVQSLAYGAKLSKTSPVLDHLRQFNGQRYHKHVVVVQPHQSLGLFNKEMGRPHPAAKMRLLCTLLNNADSACRSEGTKFCAVFSP